MGRLIIVSGVSGSGKSSIVGGATAQGIGKRIITCTTRAPRINNNIAEVDGVDYFFLSREEFEKQKNAGAFAEHAINYGKYYGTRKKDIAMALLSTNIAFAIVDTKGAASLIEIYPDALSVFIDVPRDEIYDRLISRGDSKESTLRRLAEFKTESKQSLFFDIAIPNHHGKLDETIPKFIEVAMNKKRS